MDDMMVLHTEGPIVRVDDYYPFGLTFNSSERSGFTTNNYLYNQGEDPTSNAERQPELGLDMTMFRMYDYALGRFTSIDPKADQANQESWTPYQYAFNNPILNNDPLGDTVVVGNISWIDKALDYIGYETDAMAYQRQVQGDLDQLKQDDPEVAEMITELENSPNTHTIGMPKNDGKGNRVTLDTDKVDNGESQGTKIGYDPNNEKTVSGEKRTPRVGLAHELQHSYDSDIDVIPTTIEVGGVPL